MKSDEEIDQKIQSLGDKVTQMQVDMFDSGVETVAHWLMEQGHLDIVAALKGDFKNDRVKLIQVKNNEIVEEQS